MIWTDDARKLAEAIPAKDRTALKKLAEAIAGETDADAVTTDVIAMAMARLQRYKAGDFSQGTPLVIDVESWDWPDVFYNPDTNQIRVSPEFVLRLGHEIGREPTAHEISHVLTTWYLQALKPQGLEDTQMELAIQAARRDGGL